MGQVKTYKLPTGKLIVDKYSRGLLETLSIGDYGKAANVKADFLGYTKPIHGVANQPCMPLSEKWVITVSTQYGCPMKCTFCDVPKLKFLGNATFTDLRAQFYAAIAAFPNVQHTSRLNLHFARMGEPIMNPATLEFAEWVTAHRYDIEDITGLMIDVFHPVMTTSLPRKFAGLKQAIMNWAQYKMNVGGQAGFQFSINSTNDKQRAQMYQDLCLPLADFAEIARGMPRPLGRKYCLNFALASGYEVDAKRLASLFNPRSFMVKITPIHETTASKSNGIETRGGYASFAPYEEAEAALKAEGFDVLVFVPSADEEDGLVTCGNAILGGSKLRCQPTINIAGQR